MKRGRKLTVNERKHASKSVSNIADWQISKKESDMWLLVHKITGQPKKVLAP